MTDPVNPDDDILARRTAFAIHVAMCGTFGQLLGRDVTGSMMPLWDPGSPLNTYGLDLRRRATALLEAVPEIRRLVTQENWLIPTARLVHEANQQVISARFSESEIQEAQSSLEGFTEILQDAFRGIEGGGESPLGDDAEVDLETLAREPWRLRAAIPPGWLGLSPRELERLESVLGIDLSDTGDAAGNRDEYAQTILPLLIDQITFMETLTDEARGGLRRRNSRLWKWAGTPKPEKDGPIDYGALAVAMRNLFKMMSTVEQRRRMLGYLVGIQLRRQYGLSEGRKTDNFSQRAEWGSLGRSRAEGRQGSPPWEPEDVDSAGGFEEVEARIVVQAILEAAPLAQREAVELYLEAAKLGQSVSALCRERGKDPNLVRNNYQALKRKVKERSSLI